MTKMEWTYKLGQLINKDSASGVSAMFYHIEQNARGWKKETVAIEYTNGKLTQINVTGNSLGAIMQEVTREVYGSGAFGKIED